MKWKIEKFGHPQEGIFDAETSDAADAADCPTCNYMGSPVGHYNVGDTFFIQATDEHGKSRIQRMEVVEDVNRFIDDIEPVGPMSRKAKDLAKLSLVFVQSVIEKAQVNFSAMKLFWFCRTVTEEEARKEIGKFGAN